MIYTPPVADSAMAKDAQRWQWAIALQDNVDTFHSIVLCHEDDTNKINERVDAYCAAKDQAK